MPSPIRHHCQRSSFFIRHVGGHDVGTRAVGRRRLARRRRCSRRRILVVAWSCRRRHGDAEALDVAAGLAVDREANAVITWGSTTSSG